MDCAICFEQITHTITASTLSCNHTFHIKCITGWTELNPTCPCCRHNLAPLEVYYATRESIRPPPVDTTRYLYNPAFEREEEWEDIPERFREYVYNQKHHDIYSAWVDINSAALKIQRAVKGAAVRSMYAWVFTVARFPRKT